MTGTHITPAPALWIGATIAVNGALTILNAFTWSLLWLAGYESIWSTTAMLMASLLFVEFHFIQRIVHGVQFQQRMLARFTKTADDVASAGSVTPFEIPDEDPTTNTTKTTGRD